MKRIIRESFLVLPILIVIEILGGQALYTAKFIDAPILLIFVPSINAVCGNIGSILGSRLSSAFYLGTIKPKLNDKIFIQNIKDIIILGIIVFFILSIIVYNLPAGIEKIKLFQIMFFTGTLLVFMAAFIAALTTILSIKLHLDPDNVVIPTITTITDLTGIFILIGIAYMVIP